MAVNPWDVVEEQPLQAPQNPQNSDASAPVDEWAVVDEAAAQFDPESDGYDYESALSAGIHADETGHWPSRNPKTGQILKGRGHPTFHKTIAGEEAAGFQITRGADGKYYSSPVVDEAPAAPAAPAEPTGDPRFGPPQAPGAEPAPMAGQAPQHTGEEGGWDEIARAVAANADDLMMSQVGGFMQAEGERAPAALDLYREAAEEEPDGLMGRIDRGLSLMRLPGEFMLGLAGGMSTDSGLPGSPGMKQRMARAGEKIHQRHQQKINEKMQALNLDEGSGKWFVAHGAQSFLNMIPAVVGSVITKSPAIGSTIMGSQVYGDSYGRARAEGMDPEAARQKGVFDAMAEAIPEYIPLSMLIKPGSSFWGRVAGTAGTEAIQEMVTGLLQRGYEAGVIDIENMTWADVKRFAEAQPKQMWQDAVLGAGVGAAMAAGTHPFVGKEGEEGPPPPDQPPPDEVIQPAGEAPAERAAEEALNGDWDVADETPADGADGPGAPPSAPPLALPAPVMEVDPEGQVRPLADADRERREEEQKREAEAQKRAEKAAAAWKRGDTEEVIRLRTAGTPLEAQDGEEVVAKRARDARLPKGLDDPRLLRDGFRNGLQSMSQELVVRGGKTYVGGAFTEFDKPADKRSEVIRTQSENPQWFQDLAASDVEGTKGATVKAVRKAIDKALAGEPLGTRQARWIQWLLDEITDGRTSPGNIDYARQQLEAAREMRRAARLGLLPTPPVEAYEADDAIAGEIFDEQEYDPEWDANTRTLYELAEAARELDPAGTEEILDTPASDRSVAAELWGLINERQQQNRAEEGAREPGERPQAQAPADGFGLEGQTPEQIRAQEQQRREAEEQRLLEEQRAQADAERDSFTLTGSTRSADVAAAQGQQDLLSQPARPQTAAAPTPEPTPARQKPGTWNPHLRGIRRRDVGEAIQQAAEQLFSQPAIHTDPEAIAQILRDGIGPLVRGIDADGNLMRAKPTKAQEQALDEALSDAYLWAAEKAGWKVMEAPFAPEGHALIEQPDGRRHVFSTDRGTRYFEPEAKPGQEKLNGHLPLWATQEDLDASMQAPSPEPGVQPPAGEEVKPAKTTREKSEKSDSNETAPAATSAPAQEADPIAEIQQELDDEAQRNKELSARFARDGAIYAEHRRNEGQSLLITRQPNNNDAYRVTYFDNGTPTGHGDYGSLYGGGPVDSAFSVLNRYEVTDLPSPWSQLERDDFDDIAMTEDEARAANEADDPGISTYEPKPNALEQAGREPDESITLDTMRKPDPIWPDPEQAIIDYQQEHGYPETGPVNLTVKAQTPPVMTAEAAAAEVERWKATAKRLGKEQDNSNKVIFSLFDTSGVWSKPWEDAGYTVIRYDIKDGDDLVRFFPSGDILDAHQQGFEIAGVLAAPPCTSFAVSGARWWKSQHDVADTDMVAQKYGLWAAEYFDTPLEYANTMVAVVAAFVEFANPGFYAMENPIGRIASENDLPAPALTFNPHHYGDPYTKKTLFWGVFNPALPTANVEPTEGSLIHKLRGDVEADKARRSQTPEGMAYAFFMANAEGAMDGEPAATLPATQESPPAELMAEADQAEQAAVTAGPALLPSTKQRAGAPKNVMRVLEGLGLQEAVMQPGDFHQRISNDPFMDLVIERHASGPDGRERLYFTHYYEQGGDQILDAEMVFDIAGDGTLVLAETATSSSRGEIRNRDNAFARMFSKNLIDQGFPDALKAAQEPAGTELADIDPGVELRTSRKRNRTYVTVDERLEDTGEEVEVEMTATRRLTDLKKRIETLSKLVDCIRK